MTEHRLVGGKHPWYVFRGHPIPDKSENEDSLVKFEDMPTPPLLQKAFERMIPSSNRGKEGEESREIYVNSQWALGGEGTGAPVSPKHHISHHITLYMHILYWIHIPSSLPFSYLLLSCKLFYYINQICYSYCCC